MRYITNLIPTKCLLVSVEAAKIMMRIVTPAFFKYFNHCSGVGMILSVLLQYELTSTD